MSASQNIILGVSSCLLGHNVRYNGEHKLNQIIAHTICSQFQCIAICPEYAIGLGVPRKPVQLVKNENKVKVLGVEEPNKDITQSILHYADCILSIHPNLCGYIFKARSPSCGVTDTPVFDI